MISKDGEIAHIDFGYIMNREPTSRNLFGGHTIKFNKTILMPLLNDEKNIDKPFNDIGYQKLIDSCIDGFIALRSKNEI